MASPPGLIFVTVGTDHHPFDRLITWVDSWLATNGHRGVRCLMQSGTGTIPRHASWKRFLPHEESLAACQDATAIVSHGGPGTIMSCRSLGLLPIVVPRRKGLGEHVDDHQVAFARRMAEQGEVKLAERREELWALLDRAVDKPAAFRAPARRVSADHAVTRFEELVNDLLGLRGGDAAYRRAGVPWPRVSVVVPTRDRPELLRRSVRAVLAQRYPGEVECVVVFDQSELTPLAFNPGGGRSVRAIRNDRAPGLAGARNAGALAAQGELLAFCDDDDVWHPDKLHKQVELLEARPDATAVACGTVVRYGNRSIARPVGPGPLTFRDLLRSRHMEIHPSSVVLSRAHFLNAIGLVDEALPGSYAEDYEWLLRAARRGPIVAVPELLVTISWNRVSYFAGRWEMIARALRYLLDRYPEFRAVPQGLARVEGQVAFALAASGRRREAMVWVRRCLRSSLVEPRGYMAVAVATGLVSPDSLLHLAHRFGKGI